MITPSKLQIGDCIGIVSTARKISKEELKPALQLLEKWGLQYVMGKTIGAEENQFAGHDDLRAEDFQKMMDDPKIKAIWCAKGGYGTVRILDKLDFSTLKKSPKWVIGYSDVTALHSHIHNLGIETLHAQILQNLENKSEETSASIKNILFGNPYKIDIESTAKLNRPGKAEGILVGGNLSLLYSLCGSNSALKTEGKILFIEDLDEYLYHVDRMMMNLKRNGMLQNLAGLIVGGMTDMHDSKIPFGKNAEEIVYDAVSEYNYPVCFNFPAGHIDDNRALILGRKIELDISKREITLSFKL
ncbi:MULTISPECIES: LD-carboxypeptidase [Aequorivita]|uniref:LD-carboxypeptidase n=1 Tax=Aequorivita iocasae TaxID=2803865 RepID=A0ABX7DXQ6_9FLAO|nr:MULTISPECIES: LD-carboxypeptidase [Aequorivita]QQX77554.1 LD-carboxypeptidase [Aequorivita iocasae]UCA57047.1 LD-carboxypeptidase [Aequorivita sp. F7]